MTFGIPIFILKCIAELGFGMNLELYTRKAKKKNLFCATTLPGILVQLNTGIRVVNDDKRIFFFCFSGIRFPSLTLICCNTYEFLYIPYRAAPDK